ncbi:MAG: hypothetical protein LBS59_03015 [Puniceicoccales bacterium]|nr:hypothetical protein [Puniceicoccales bacterium]
MKEYTVTNTNDLTNTNRPTGNSVCRRETIQTDAVCAADSRASGNGTPPLSSATARCGGSATTRFREGRSLREARASRASRVFALSHRTLAAAALLAFGTVALPTESGFPLLVPGAYAATYIWTGGSGAAPLAWGDTANWSPSGVPGSAADTAAFDLSGTGTPALAGQTISLGASRSLNALTFSGSTAIYANSPLFTTIAPGADPAAALYFSGADAGISLSGGESLKFGANVYANADFVVANNSVTFGSITFDNIFSFGGHQVTFDTIDSTGVITLNGDILGSGTLVKTGTGTLVVTRNGNSLTGNIAFNDGTIAISASNALGTDRIVLGGGVGGSRKLSLAAVGGVAASSTLANTIDIAASDLVVGRSDNPQQGATALTLTLNPALSFTSGIGSGDRTITVESFTAFDIGENQSFSGSGTLVKNGGGTLVMRSANNTFAALSVTAGKFAAHLTTAASTLGGSASVLGAGTVTVNGQNTLLEISADVATNTLTLGATANISLLNGATLAFNSGTLDLAAGNINLNGTGNLVLSGTVKLGDTAIVGVPAAGLAFAGDVVFKSTTGAITNTHVLNLTSSAAQTLSRDGSGQVTLSKVLNKTGAGTVTLDPTITQLNLASGMNLSAGTLKVGATRISGSAINIANATLSFEGSPAVLVNQVTAPLVLSNAGTVTLHGNSRTFQNVSTVANAVGTISLGGSRDTSTTLDLGNLSLGAASLLRILDYTGSAFSSAPDIVKATSMSASSGQVWFYGYNKGASLSNGVLTPNSGFLTSTWDNGALDYKWFSAGNWEGDDIFNIPNSPGVSATFASGVPSSSVIRLDNNSVTLGTLSIGASSLSFTNGKLIFDSGVTGAQAKYIMGGNYTVLTSDLSVQLNSDLKIETTSNYTRFLGKISGTGRIVFENTGGGSIQFGNAENDFSGGIFLNNGRQIGVTGAPNSTTTGNYFGTGPITIGAGGGAIVGYDQNLGLASGYTRKIQNQIILGGDLTASAIGFYYNGEVAVTGDKKITAVGPTKSAEYSGQSVIFGPDLKFTGSGKLTLDTGNYGMRIEGMGNTFSGGLVKSGSSYLHVLVPSTQSRITLGALENGYNPLGSGNISITEGRIQWTANAPTYLKGGTLDIASGSSLWVVDGNATGTVYLQGGNLTGSGTLRFDHNLEIYQTAISGEINLETYGRSNNTISLQSGNNKNGIIAVNSFSRKGSPDTTTTIGTSVEKFQVQSKISLYAGTLKLTNNDQLGVQGKTPQDGRYIELAGGTLDLNGTKQNTTLTHGQGDTTVIPFLHLTGDSTILTGADGGITFTSAFYLWSKTAQLFIQNGDGDAWGANTDHSYIRFKTLYYLNSTIPDDRERLANITFSGYEAGAKLVEYDGFHYLLPASNVTVNEWKGSGTLWGTASNWSKGSVPNNGGAIATIGGLDGSLQGKTIDVNGNYTIGKLSLQSSASSYTIGGSWTLSFNGTHGLSIGGHGALLVHSKSNVTMTTNWNLVSSLELQTQGIHGSGVELVLANSISGNGNLILKGNGNNDRYSSANLVMKGNNAAWTGNLIWEDNIALAILGGASDYRLTGSGHFYIGGTNSTAANPNLDKVYSFATDNPSGTGRTIRLDGGYTLNANLTIGRYSQSQSNSAFDNLTLEGDGKLGAGTHTINTVWTASSETRPVLKLDGVISNAIAGTPGGIKKTGGGELHLTSSNTFTGDFSWNEGSVRMDADNALGLGNLYMRANSSDASSAELVATPAGGVKLQNRVIWDTTGTQHTSGTITFEDSLGNSTIGANVSRYFYDGAFVFGKNFVLTGDDTGKLYFYSTALRILGSGNTFSGGLTSTGILEIGASSVGNSGSIISGPVGRGTLTLNSSSKLRVYSSDSSTTSHTLSNNLALTGNYLSFGKSEAVENKADRLVLTASYVDLPAAPQISFDVSSGATLRVESRVRENTGNRAQIVKLGTGTLELTNTNNQISQNIIAQAGTVRTEVSGNAVSINNTTASADVAFGTGARITQTATGTGTAGTFEIKATTANATVTLESSGANRYTLNDGGSLKISGTNVTTVLGSGGSLVSADTAGQEGVLDAQNIHATNFNLGVKIKAETLTVKSKANGGTGVVLEKSNLLADVGNLVFANGTVTASGPALNLNKTTQTVNNIRVEGSNVLATIDMDISGSAWTATNPLTFTINGSINVADTSILHFLNWNGDTTTGLGPTRILTPGMGIGAIVTNVKLGASASTIGVVRLNSDPNGAQLVLMPFDTVFTWTGADAADSQIWTGKNNWEDVSGGHSSYPDSATAMAVFDGAKATLGGKIINLSGGKTLGTLEFKNGASSDSFSLNGGTLSLDSGFYGDNTQTSILQNSAMNVTINSPIVARYDTAQGKSTSETIFIGMNGSGDLIFNGQISGINAGVKVQGNGTGKVILNGTNTFTGGFTLESGTVLVGNNNAFGGGTLTHAGGSLGATSAGAVTVSNDYTITGDVTFVGDQDLTFSGNVTLSGNRTLTSSTTGGAVVWLGANGKTINVFGGTQLTLSGAGNFGLLGALAENIKLVVNHAANPGTAPSPLANTTIISYVGGASFKANLEILSGRVVSAGSMGENNNYTKDIILGENGVFQYTGTDVQTLSGKIKPGASGKYGTLSNASTGTLIIAGRGFTNSNPVFGSYYQRENPFQGNLHASSGTLQIAGPLGTVTETFDGGTSWQATYYHARYTGSMNIETGGTVEFAYNGDYQYASGAITGTGTLKINSGMPFYYAGNANNFAGTTTVAGGSIFHLNTPAGQSYGNGAGAFRVKGGSVLYVGGGGKVHTQSFVMENNTTLVVNPGQFTIDASTELKFGELTSDNITLVFRLDTSDIDSFGAPNPKLTVTGNGGSVVLNAGTTLRVDAFGYIPQPSQDNGLTFPGHFTLMDGLDTGAMALAAGVNVDALAEEIFGKDVLEILNSRFSLSFTTDGRLILEQTGYTNIPEPGTYGLFSGVFIVAFALVHRRRKKKQTPPPAPVVASGQGEVPLV